MNAKDLLSHFLFEHMWPINRRWLYATDPVMSVYVRKGNRSIEGSMMKTLEIATVEVEIQGKGTFTDFFDFALNINPFPVLLVLVESVQTERFCNFFRRRGMVELPNSIPPSFYLMKGKVL